MVKECPICKNNFKGKKKQITCSKSCRGALDKINNRVKFNCNHCGKESNKTKYQFERSKRNYCSADCRYKDMTHVIKGVNNPNWKGKTYEENCPACGIVFTYKDYHGSKVKYCSRECKGKHQSITLIKENNPNWKGNIPEEKRLKDRTYYEYAVWRKEVFVRDGYNCIKCGYNSTKNNRLVAHHVLNYYSHENLRTEVSNGVTFCDKCHREFHRINGTLFNNREQVDKFLIS